MFTVLSVFVLSQLYFQIVPNVLALIFSTALIAVTGTFLLGLFRAIDPKQVTTELREGAQFELALVEVMRMIAESIEITPAEKQKILVAYFKALTPIDSDRCEKHLQHAALSWDAYVALGNLLIQLTSEINASANRHDTDNHKLAMLLNLCNGLFRIRYAMRKAAQPVSESDIYET